MFFNFDFKIEINIYKFKIKFIKTLSFPKAGSSDFATTLKKRVAEYFKSNQIDRFGNYRMVIKSAVMLLLFAVPFTLILTGIISHPLFVILAYVLAGFGMAGIGMGIMHDAIHGAFSKKKWVNKIMSYTINLIGSNKDMWRIQHNVLHHSFTNIQDHDDDINTPFFLRFSPNAPKSRIHRYQQFYAWFFYGLTTISWVTFKDFVNLFRFRSLGLIPNKKTFSKYFLSIAVWKINFFILTLVLPLWLTDISAVTVIIAFFAMHFVTGVIISTVFQAAHVMPNTEFPMPDSDGRMENDRLIHQLLTTSNFSQKSKWWSWFIGGLTNQVEHHLFPHISHIHYKKLAPIVKQTALEFGLPYNSNGSFFGAVKEHFLMLKHLGTVEGVQEYKTSN